ncbi:hypothetical protein ACP7H9_12900 [Idiomarina sp. ST20R2A10]|uniref:hypothetical protein n=1 Tax=Idiomarina sp. ST20R2A10 TaxID=3418369 RepID=UPI003EC90888
MDNEAFELIKSISVIATPFLLAVIGGFGWVIKQKVESNQSRLDSQRARISELEDKLREDRIKTYNALLEPFFLLFTSEEAFSLDKKFKGKDKNNMAMSKMLSVEYRSVGFKLSLVANDEVVRCYNKLMQFFYHTEADARPLMIKTSHWIALMGELLLEIRKSMGNKESELDSWEMIEWFMSDADKLKTMHLTQEEVSEL